jgi:hypothetical protein
MIVTRSVTLAVVVPLFLLTSLAIGLVRHALGQ